MVIKKQGLLLLVCIFFCLSSCFEIIEEINTKADGSGNMLITLNLSQSKSKLASILLLDSINGHKVPDQKEIRLKLEEAAARLRKMPGISQVSYNTDFNNYIATIRFSFANLSNINQISTTIFKELKTKPMGSSAYQYNAANRLFSRNYTYMPQAFETFKKLKANDQAVFKGASYTGIYRFDKQVTGVSNKQAKISASKKAVMLRTGVLDLINGKVNISNNIQLSR